MKRFLYILAAALTLATSCKVSEGGTPNTMAVGKIIGEECITIYTQTLTDLDYALICDYFLSANGEENIVDVGYVFLRYFNTRYNYKIVRDGSKIDIICTYSLYNSTTSYEIASFATDGKLLSEGGVWTTLLTTDKVTITTDNEGGYIYKSEDEAHNFSLQISNVAIDSVEGITYDISGSISYIYNYQKPQSSVILTTQIVEPLSYKCGSDQPTFLFERGEIEAVCEDNRYNSVDEVRISFTQSNKAFIHYRGQSDSISYKYY